MPSVDDNPAPRRGMKSLPLVVALLIAAAGCGEKERAFVANVSDGDNSPTMTTYNVETFISDSGYTRYHLSTPTWLIYENASEPFWRFPAGLYMQQYDLQLRPDASMDCDSATYFSRLRLWRLDGHVVMVNTLRDTFLSQQLFWDQAKRRVYTDSFIHIVRSDRTIEGYGFESNENMTAYTINRPTAIIPVDRRPGGPAEADSAAEAPDSILPPPASRRRAAAPRPSQARRPDDQQPIAAPGRDNNALRLQKTSIK